MGGKEGSKLLEGEYGSYHVLAHPLSLFPGLNIMDANI